MNRWTDKIAVVTGASSGIGAAICKDLIQAGMIVIGLARRVDKIDEIIKDLKVEERFFSKFCDVSNQDSIREAFDWISEKFGSVQVLVNNAAISKCTMILDESNESDLRAILNTNLLGLILCTKSAYKLMKSTDSYGHIININSLLGHQIPIVGNSIHFNVYPASKYGVTATTEILRQELNALDNRKIRISSISPGLVKTDIFESGGFPEANQIFNVAPSLNPEDISQAILYILSTPAHVQIHELTIKPVGEMV